MELKQIINWIISLFLTRYKITVSFNKEYGDSDDKTYISKKILVQKEKHLKFRDEHDRLIEYRSASGLNYIIEDIECNKYL
jgi:phage-related protein